MTTFSKVTTVDTTNLQPGDLIHMEVAFFNVNFIHGFTSMLTGVFAKIIMIWLFHTASRLAPVRVILFILTTLNNKQHPCKCVRNDEYGTLKISTDVTKFLVNDFIISMETNGGDPNKYYPSYH